MNDAYDYLCSYRESFWRWRDQGEVLEWNGGPTIAFRDEILESLRRLGPQGLPPFRAVILVLAATRDNWHENNVLRDVLSSIPSALSGSDSFGVKARSMVAKVLGELDRVRLLDAELRTPVEAKAALCEIVFEDFWYRTSPETTQAVLQLLEDGLGEELHRTWAHYTQREWTRYHEEILGELRGLHAGLSRLEPETLRLRLRTGLDTVPEPADVEVPPAQRVRALLNELLHDEEFSGLATLARDLMAAVALPRSLADREELPIGGFSDIANRGSVDRLLLSELAHDDLTLAVRVAVNEALYLRRESPPKNPPCQRAILLETGIRCWGVPRVFSTAVALALLATGDAHTEVQVYRAKGSDVEPVDLTTRAGLTDHLAVLEVDLHPGEALEAFQREIADCDRAAEPVLITTEDVIADPQFHRALGESRIPSFLMATVNRAGQFRLSEKTPHGARRIREAHLDLVDLFAEPTCKMPPLITREGMQHLPAILSVQPFPLRLSHNVDWQRMWRAGDHGVLCLTHDRRLMYWPRDNHGAIQIMDTAPKGKLLWSSSTASVDRAVAGHLVRGGLRLLKIDVERRHCHVVPLQTDRRPDVFFSHDGFLFATTKFGREIDVMDESSGRLLDTKKIPQQVHWRNGRFFQGFLSGEWFAVFYDGQTVHFESVVSRKKLGNIKLVSTFECDGTEGPIGITERGNLYVTATGELRKVKHGLAGGVQVLAVSSDGKRIALGQGQTSSTQCRVVDVDTLDVTSQYGNPRDVVDPVYPLAHPRSYRTRFTHARVDKRGVLTLTSGKGTRWGIEYDPARNRVFLANCQFTPAGGQPFLPVPAPRDVGYRLKAATWKDGSRIFLDNRGLLHLKSADQAVPETTIVLNDNAELSGWCSDGRLWGTSYHLGDHRSADKNTVFETAILAFIQRLP